jgi:hypothetical protein
LLTKDDEKILGQCSLSSSGELTAYEKTYYDSGTNGPEGMHYYFGSDEYIANYCWPGFSPWYSYADKYPNDLFHSFWVAINDMMDVYGQVLLAGHGHHVEKPAPPPDHVYDWDKIYN